MATNRQPSNGAKLIVILVVLWAAFVTGVAMAQETRDYLFTWQKTTTRTDGTALTTPEFLRYEIICANGGLIATINDHNTLQKTVLGITQTDTCYAVTIATKYDDLTGELSSAPSGSVQVVIPKLLNPANPPAGFGASVVGS